ncbi:hypothetical protein DI272_15385 [Streptomyces sp. Act143]|uniref:hypothetical protein n=1 Tax=Streptomyces sp. Act143 TaxID=2200760 RepID=UPI000D67D0CD|nr:hypothetical protein [Streptomyces sp. Act143]PWI15393.1 hypothetical protein DI272_15385 [Streptomyces sp. Act143]
MGTKTVDETGAETGPETKADEETVAATDLTKADPTGDDTDATDATDATDEVTDEDLLASEGAAGDASEGPTGVGQGAGAVVSAVLGLVSLTGGWIGTVAAARETLVGQLQTSSTASVAKQVKEVYGDAWHTTAVWGGLFALAALCVGAFVLARPAFGAPGKPQAVWIKSVAWAGVSLGVIGLLLAVLKYTDILLGLPSTS